MASSIIFERIIVPEWKQCYLDYAFLRTFVRIIDQLAYNIEIINTIVASQQLQRQKDLNKELQPYKSSKLIIVKQIREQLNTKLKQVDTIFQQQYKSEIQTTQMFYEMKTYELKQTFNKIKEVGINNFSKSKLPLFLLLIEHLYVQSKFAQQMIEVNLKSADKILRKRWVKSNELLLPIAQIKQKSSIFDNYYQKLIQQVENYYIKKNQFQDNYKICRQKLRQNITTATQSNIDACLLGLWIGISIAIIIALFFIVNISHLALENNSRFAKDFPTWRGLAMFIFYIWVLGFDTYMFQKFRISHRMILCFDDYNYSSAVTIFKLAGLHTSVYLVLFSLYILNLTSIIKFQNFNSVYLALVSWFSFIAFFILPLKLFNYKGRLYILKLFGQSLISPFKGGITFPISWLTDQFVSLIIPLKDVAYTICYYTRLDFAQNNPNDPCSQSKRAQIVLIVAVIVLGYRIMQCIRQGIDKKMFFGTPFFFNMIKYLVTLMTAIFSYRYSYGNSSSLPIWITFALISSIYSFTWDLKMDWDLLKRNNKNFFLRKYLTFLPSRNYYIIASANLIMRFAWIMTLSPSIVELFGSPPFFILIAGMIQIFRRGVWNLLRVQKEHLDNCQNFKAVANTDRIFQKLSKVKNIQQKQMALIQQKIFLDQDNSSRYMREVLINIQISVKNEDEKKKMLADLKQKVFRKQILTNRYNSVYQTQYLLDINNLMKQVEILEPTKFIQAKIRLEKIKQQKLRWIK